MQVLLEHDAPTDCKNKQQATPFHCACVAHDFTRDLDEGPIECLKLLIEKTPDDKLSNYLNYQDIHGRTCLMFAVTRGCNERVKLLLEGGCDTKILDNSGDSCVHVASIHGHFEILVEIIKHLSKKLKHSTEQLSDFLNQKGRRGMTAMGYAGIHGHNPVITQLLKHKADINFVDDRNRNIYHCVAYSGDNDTLGLVSSQVQAQAKKNFLDTINDEDEAEMAAEKKDSKVINDRDDHKLLPLHYAAWSAKSSALKWLLNRKVDTKIERESGEKVIISDKDVKGRSPLHYAMMNDSIGK